MNKIFPVYSYILLILCLFSSLSFAIDVFQFTDNPDYSFVMTACLYGLLATILKFLPRRGFAFQNTNVQLVFLWLVISCFAGIPIYLRESSMDWLSAVFEAASGITSTGLSMYENLEEVPNSVLFWRSSLQWLGGLGIVVWVSFFMDEVSFVKRLSAHEVGLKKTDEDEYQNPLLVTKYYLFMTIILFILFYILGMNSWEALNYSMTVFSTGGFSIYDGSFSGFSLGIKVVAIFFMLLSSTNLYLIANNIRSFDFKRIFKNSYFIQYGAIIIFSFFLVFLSTENTIDTDLIFNFSSAVSTTGFSSGSLGDYQNQTIILFCLIMFIGAMTGSTAGGLRQKNLRYFVKGLKSLIFKKDFSDFSDEVRLNVRKSFLAVFSWIIMIISSTMLITFFSSNDLALSILFNVVSALTNSGLSLGTLDSSIHPINKLTFILLMIIGRINISTLIFVSFVFLSKLKKVITS